MFKYIKQSRLYMYASLYKQRLLWVLKGKQLPGPHALKVLAILYAKRKYNLKTLVETGTYKGDMVRAVSVDFENIFSVELDAALYSAAKKRFETEPHISIHQGDSVDFMRSICPMLDSPVLFWLDAHYSGGETAMGSQTTPVLDELDIINSHAPRGSVILIDDERCFGKGGYPAVDKLAEHLSLDDYTISVKDDIIRCLPK